MTCTCSDFYINAKESLGTNPHNLMLKRCVQLGVNMSEKELVGLTYWTLVAHFDKVSPMTPLVSSSLSSAISDPLPVFPVND